MSAKPQDVFAAGAARAAGERAKRTRTPLLGTAAGPDVAPASGIDTGGMTVTSRPAPLRVPSAPARSLARPEPSAPVPVTPVAPPPQVRTRPARAARSAVGAEAPTQPPGPSVGAGRPRRPRRPTGAQARAAAPTPTPTPDTAPAARAQRKPSRSRDATARLAAAGHDTPPASTTTPATRSAAYRVRHMPLLQEPKISDSVLAAALTRQELTPDLEDLLAALIGALRTVAAASGKGPDEVEQAVARSLAFLSRRIAGSYEVDDFGFDPDWTEHVFLPLMRMVYRQWFRVEVRGIENVPADGSALIVSNHSGTIAWDAMMAQVAVHDEHPSHRFLRLLGGDLVFKTPLLGTLSRQQGSTLATNYDAESLLRRGELVAVFPEGYKGVGKSFSERYKLQRFGRGGFVSAAVHTGAPIVPLAIVGAEETYPLLGNVPALARLLNTPYFPITPTFPWLGPLGMIPLPSKWIMEFGEPIDTAHFGSSVAEDPMLIFDLTDQVRETIQQTLYTLLMLRRSAFS